MVGGVHQGVTLVRDVNCMCLLFVDPSPQPILDGGDGQHRLVMSGTNVDVSGSDGEVDKVT